MNQHLIARRTASAPGLGAAAAPGFADPLNPTVAELRRNAIFNNDRALLDVNPASGFGTLSGPNVGSTVDIPN